MVNSPVTDSGGGRPLDSVVREVGPLPVNQAVEYLIQAAGALGAANAQGVIHRDLRPGNLLIDRAGDLHVRGLSSPRAVNDRDLVNSTIGSQLSPDGTAVDWASYTAPELAQGIVSADHRADIYSLGCTLYFLLTGRAPFAATTSEHEQRSPAERRAPSLRTVRPDVSMRLETCFLKMTAQNPDERPRDLTEVIALLEASKLAPEALRGTARPRLQSQRGPMAAGNSPHDVIPSRPSNVEPSLRVRREEREGFAIDSELNLEDLVNATETPPTLQNPSAKWATLLKRPPRPAFFRAWSRETALAFCVLAGGLFLAVSVGLLLMLRPRANDEIDLLPVPGSNQKLQLAKPQPPPRPAMRQTTIFDGRSTRGWMLCNRTALPSRNVQHDGLNPHKSGSYLVVYEHKLGDFVLDFDYKLSRHCNTGVFLRVSDLNDPVQTGIEVALDDARYGDDRDSGGFLGLAAPGEYAQKPDGQWNHMTITADGPRLSVVLNGKEVSSIDLEAWTVADKGRDGSDPSSQPRAITHRARIGYLGFQDLGGDCWFNDISLKTPVP